MVRLNTQSFKKIVLVLLSSGLILAGLSACREKTEILNPALTNTVALIASEVTPQNQAGLTATLISPKVNQTPNAAKAPSTQATQKNQAKNPQISTSEVISNPASLYTATPDNRLTAKYWGGWPVIPIPSEKAKAIYLKGLQSGNNPRSFSVVGDCQSEPNVFLGVFASDRYRLDQQDEYLKRTIDWYATSFNYKSVSVKDGMSVASVLSPLWSDSTRCYPNELPILCEIRSHKPAIIFINLGTNWKANSSTSYDKYLRQVVEVALALGVVPILSTKADNIEGDNSLNLVTAQVAYDYEVPLWNFWRTANGLPNHGLDPNRDSVYLSTDAWYLRSLTALQALDSVTFVLQGQQPPPLALTQAAPQNLPVMNTSAPVESAPQPEATAAQPEKEE